MASSKEKRFQSAERQIQRGQYDKALAEYQRILRENPSDTEVMLHMSELLVQLSRPKDAANVLYRLGVVLAQGEHHLRAVSTFNQVLKLDPQSIDAHRYLADLTLKVGMQDEAKMHLETLAKHYDLQGDAKNAFTVHRVLAEIDPSNVANLVRLGELCSSQGKSQDAVRLFTRAAKVLKEQGKLNEYLKVLERLVYHDPENLDHLKELANLYSQLGQFKKALAKLQAAYRIGPTDLEVLELLVNLFEQIDETQKAIHTLKAMAALHMENYALDKVHQVYERVLELDPADADARQFLAT